MNRPKLAAACVLVVFPLTHFGCRKPEVIDGGAKARIVTTKPEVIDDATKARTDKVKRDILPIFEVVADMERFSQKERQIAITKLMDKGWPAAIADLEYLDAHLPKNDPDRYRVEKYLKAAKEVMDKSRTSK